MSSLVLMVGLAAPAAWAQYPGHIEKNATDAPTLRAIGVIEWTGDEGKPAKSRLVPITVFDGQALQDGNVYLARPLPLALGYETEYVIQRNGKPIGLYDITKAGQQDGTWVGFGSWKPMLHPKPLAPPKPIDDGGFDANDDKPVLHRRQGSASGSSSGSGSSDSESSGSTDPDRPTLRKKPDSGDPSSGNSSGSGSASASDPDRPTLHKDSAQNSPAAASSGAAAQPKADTSDGEHSGVDDPNRPHLIRGKPAGSVPDVLPSQIGIPTEIGQVVAVSDVKSRPEHSWEYTWANPDDEDKMKAQMEEIARRALAPKTPPSSSASKTTPSSPAPKSASTRSHAKSKPEPLALVDEEFRVFELTYGGGASMVLSARTEGPAKEQKFVTLIAQPDLYGNVLVLFKSVTDGAHLDETPRMRLVDAVDALADNRGELLFELRGATQRQFALYRVLRGSAEKIFVTGGGEFGVAPGI